MRFLRSSSTRLILSHTLVATLAVTAAVILDALLLGTRIFELRSDEVVGYAAYEWRLGLPDRLDPDSADFGLAKCSMHVGQHPATGECCWRPAPRSGPMQHRGCST